VIDVGCGGGLLSEGMAALGAEVTGIDLSEKALGVARLHLYESGHKIDYRLIAAETMADQKPRALSITSPASKCLEHVPDPASTVAACAKLVKPGGQVFLSTLNRNAKAYVVAVLGAEYLLNLLPRGTHEYTRFLKPAELSRLCRQAGLEVQEITGLRYNPFSREGVVGSDTDINYLLRARRLPEAVLFDLDGTLADTAPDLGGALNELRREQGRPAALGAVAAARLVRCARADRRRPWHHTGRYPLPQPAAALSRHLPGCTLRRHPPVRPALPSTSASSSSAVFAWGIVTNKSQRFAIPLIEQLGCASAASASSAATAPARQAPRPPDATGQRRDRHRGGAMHLRRRRRARCHFGARGGHAHRDRRLGLSGLRQAPTGLGRRRHRRDPRGNPRHPAAKR
jgi:2-polyprenyl-6-hydroxyphenyl methylase/3-demethylubiquinone-9 3-methyltransferase